MLKIAICDDDKYYTDKILDLIHQENQDFDIDVFSSGSTFLSSTSKYDIIFMDVELPDANGIKLLQKNHYDSLVIIMTSHDEEVLNGYYIRAFRFLLKPIDNVLFHEALTSAINEVRKVASIEVIDKDNCICKISINDIVYAEASDKKTGIRTLTDFYYTNILINKLPKIFNSDFYFVHRTYILNMNYIDKIDVKKRQVTMREGSVLSVSRLKWTDFKETFYEFLKFKMNGD